MTKVVTCGSCDTGLHETAKYRDECGPLITALGDTAQYQKVTMLFADVLRSMDIAAAVDMERLREIMTGLVERSAVVVQHAGGTVEYKGDGAMALFCAPFSFGDPPFAHAWQRWLYNGRRTDWRPKRTAEMYLVAVAGWTESGPGDRR